MTNQRVIWGIKNDKRVETASVEYASTTYLVEKAISE